MARAEVTPSWRKIVNRAEQVVRLNRGGAVVGTAGVTFNLTTERVDSSGDVHTDHLFMLDVDELDDTEAVLG